MVHTVSHNGSRFFSLAPIKIPQLICFFGIVFHFQSPISLSFQGYTKTKWLLNELIAEDSYEFCPLTMTAAEKPNGKIDITRHLPNAVKRTHELYVMSGGSPVILHANHSISAYSNWTPQTDKKPQRSPTCPTSERQWLVISTLLVFTSHKTW